MLREAKLDATRQCLVHPVLFNPSRTRQFRQAPPASICLPPLMYWPKVRQGKERSLPSCCGFNDVEQVLPFGHLKFSSTVPPLKWENIGLKRPSLVAVDEDNFSKARVRKLARGFPLSHPTFSQNQNGTRTNYAPILDTGQFLTSLNDAPCSVAFRNQRAMLGLGGRGCSSVVEQ